MNRLVGALAILVMTGCATSAAQQQQEQAAIDSVRVTTNPEIVKGCEFVGNVDSREKSAAELTKKLKSKTLSRGGNVLLMGPMVPDKPSQVKQTRVGGNGEAYRCANPVAAVNP